MTKVRFINWLKKAHTSDSLEEECVKQKLGLTQEEFLGWRFILWYARAQGMETIEGLNYCLERMGQENELRIWNKLT